MREKLLRQAQNVLLYHSGALLLCVADNKELFEFTLMVQCQNPKSIWKILFFLSLPPSLPPYLRFFIQG